MNATDEPTPVPAVHPVVVRTMLADVAEHKQSEGGAAWRVLSRALQIRSDAARHVMAAAARNGATWDEFSERVSNFSPDDISQLEPASAPWWRALGRIAFLHATTKAELFKSIAFYEVALRLKPNFKLDEFNYMTLSQALWDTGQAKRIRDLKLADGEMSVIEETLLEADLISAEQGAGSRAWQDFINEKVFNEQGLHGIRIQTGDGTPFDRLGPAETLPKHGGVLITVVMTTYRREREIFTAVQSILDQSWQNLELIIVDDHSGPDFDGVLASVCALDPRIRILRQATNQGAYAGRNRALRDAKGEFVTFQDDDDWSHPQRLERQAEPLLKSNRLHSTLSGCARVNEDLQSQTSGSSGRSTVEIQDAATW